MHKISVFVISALALVLPIQGQVFFKISADTLRSYAYSGGDEFNQYAIDQSSWQLTPWPRTNMSQRFAFDARNTTIENGVAVFALKEKDSLYTIDATEVDSGFVRKRKISLNNHQYRLKYTAGIIISRQKYHYGLYELRFKVEKGKGVWPAFWFFGGNKNEEIDAFELKGEKNDRIHVDTHCPYGCDRGYKNKLGFNANWGDWLPVTGYLHDGFNVMLLDWQPGEVTWYINGYPLAYFKGDFPNPMSLYLNTQVASDFSAFQPGPDAGTTYPNNFYVDYLRVWKAASSGTQPVLTTSGNAKVSNRFMSDYKIKATGRRGLMYNKSKFNTEGMVSLTLLPDNQLVVNVLGGLNDAPAAVMLKGAYNTYMITTAAAENTLAIDPRETELELVIQNGRKQYRQKITISR